MSYSVQIVVAEDNQADVRLLQEALEEQHLSYDLDVLTDGEEALHFAELAGSTGNTPCPDLFVLDLHLPKIDGPDVLQRFRANENCTNTPVIVLSGSTFPIERVAVEKFPGVSFVAKPTAFDDFTQLGRIIKNILTSQGGVGTMLQTDGKP